MIFHPTENRIISEEEAKRISDEAFREMERVAEQKASDDYTFDGMFNGYLEGKHYVAENGYVMFIEFQYNYDNLYRYYQYTKRFIVSFEKETEEYNRELEKEGFIESIDPEGELTIINYQSILLMIYTLFESFLRDFIEVIDNNSGVLKQPYDDVTTLEYLKFLHFQKNIFIPRKLFHQYNEIRLVRNFFAHSLNKAQAQLIKYLNQNDPCKILGKIGDRNCIFLNENYMEFAFGTIGKMVKAIEIAFEKYYPELQ